jgi:hypothetical protein
MSRQLLRKLSALGYENLGAVRTRGFGCYLLVDSSNTKLLAIEQLPFGLSWVAIHSELLELGLAPQILSVDSCILLLVENSPLATEQIQGLAVRAAQKARRQLFISGVGFVATEQKTKLEPTALILPAVALIATGLLASFWPQEQIEQTGDPMATELSCGLDMGESEIRKWILDAIDSGELVSDAISHNSDLGQIEIIIRSAIGSVISATANISCQDGRQKELSFRADLSGQGYLVSLGEKLDP